MEQLNAEDLEFSIVESPIVYLMGYSILTKNIGKTLASELISNVSTTVQQSRNREGGKIRLDKVIKDALNVNTDILVMQLEDIMEELQDDQDDWDTYLNKEIN